METEKYFKQIDKEVRAVYDLANEARAKGLDPKKKVEIPLATSLAEKVVGLISTIYPQMEGTGIAKRILELEKEYGKLDTTVSFKIAEEVAKQKFCQFESLIQAIDAGIRIGFSYTTLGVVSSPIEGFTDIKLGRTQDGKEYFKAYFSGPIRSAGTTAGCVVLMLIDYLREIFGYAKYDPTENEIKRMVTENYDYHERVTNLQYLPLEQEAEFLARHLPIQICGEPTEKMEVSNYKHLERIETNNIRGGMCLIFSEGLAQKAAKGFRLYNSAKKNGIKVTGFDFLAEYIELHEKLTSSKGKSKGDSVPTYIKDLVAGRPVFGHPSRSGSFRFRYGRGRTSGFSAASLHPATMAVTDGFIAIGTQLKIEKPTKGCAVTSCDSIDGPIVKLFNGSVKKLKTKEEAEKLYSDIEEIIYLGDILFPFSDLANRNYGLIKPGYVEEWWELDLKKNSGLAFEDLDCYDVSLSDVKNFSEKYQIPLHPNYIFYWSEISKDEFLALIDWIKHIREVKLTDDNKIVLPFGKHDKEKFEKGKRALELLGVEHIVGVEDVVLSRDVSEALLLNLGLSFEGGLRKSIDSKKFDETKTILENVNSFSSFVIKDKSGEFIGTRMGRPEKAKLRKLVGSPNVLFPVGSEGGRLRSVNEALNVGKVFSDFPSYSCKICNRETIFRTCEVCLSECEVKKHCPRCKNVVERDCEEHEMEGVPYNKINLDINYYFNKAVENLNLQRHEIPALIKGIRGTSSENHMIEHLEKGILRSIFNLQVNKDGTIRLDATELPVTYFKPKEIFVSVEKLREIGYTKDINGNSLENENQVLELKPHDVILPACPESDDEKSDDVFIKVTQFVDTLLERFYGMKPFYNVKTKEDLIGKLGVCMAPHNCAGVICRFIGFSHTQGLLASPYMHAAMRRDCDGDEAAVMLLLDVLLNFSREFLPSHRGGTQDAPLVLNSRIEAGEVDDQILDLELSWNYPLELYELAEQKKHSSEVKSVETVKNVLKKGLDPFSNIGYTHNTENFNDGVIFSSYKKLATMMDKVRHQMELVEKIRAVDTSDVARLIIERHFIRDMRGNLRKFSMQSFRCVGCNEIIRRPTLKGVCSLCGGKIIFTIHEGGIKKYLEPTLELAKKYNLSPYMLQSIELTKRYIDSVFGKELEKQDALSQWL